MSAKVSGELVRLRVKEQMYDELVEQLAATEHELAHARRAEVAEIEPQWRSIANDLAGALRPYTLFRDQRLKAGRIVVETAVPAATLTAARAALDRLARQVAIESYRAHGVAVAEDTAAA